MIMGPVAAQRWCYASAKQVIMTAGHASRHFAFP